MNVLTVEKPRRRVCRWRLTMPIRQSILHQLANAFGYLLHRRNGRPFEPVVIRHGHIQRAKERDALGRLGH